MGRWWSPLTMRQKLPHRLYIGIQKCENISCTFVNLESYDMKKKAFLSTTPYEGIKNIHALELIIKDILESLWSWFWCEMSILSEYPKWHGASFSSVLYTLLAVMIFIIADKLPLETIPTWWFVHSHLFDDVCLLACYIKYKLVWSAGWCAPFMSLGLDIWPVLQIGKIDFSLFGEEKLSHNLLHLSSVVFAAWHEKKEYIDIQPIITQKNQQLPRDIWLIHISKSHDSLREKELLVSQMSITQWWDWFQWFAQQRNIHRDLYEVFLSPYDVYGHISTLLYTRLLYTMLAYVSAEIKEWVERDFFGVLMDMAWYHSSIEHNYTMLTLLYSVFDTCKKHSNELAAFVPISSIKTWWSFLVIIPRHAERVTIDTMTTMLQNTHSSPAELVYASWKEPVHMYWWVEIRQYISEGIYSEYIAKWMAQLHLGLGEKKIWLYDELLLDEVVKQWILFDLIKRKILVHGEKVNHKVLCSQSATIEIMLYLFEHINEFVPNRLLPASAYSRNKNEMVNKILMPLQDLLQEHGDEPIEVICSWTLYERTICLKKRPLCIHILTHVGD